MTWAIGNGESRNKVSIDNLTGIKVGCNGILRDYNVDYLVCVDRRMVTEALQNSFPNKILTRKDWIDRFKSPNVNPVPDLPYKGTERVDEPFQWGSGPYAVLQASICSKKIKLIGFDLYSNTNKINNLYKGTENYDEADKDPIDPRYWIHQIGKVFECFPKKKYKIYQIEDWKLPKAWKYSNVSVDNINNL